jgi:hypothetical protein
MEWFMADTRRWFWLVGSSCCAFVWLLHPILTPFLVALLAYLFDPLVDRLEKPACRGPWAWCGVRPVHLIFTALLLVLVPMLAKQLFRCMSWRRRCSRLAAAYGLPWAQEAGPGRWFLEVRQGQGRDQRAHGPDHRYRRGGAESGDGFRPGADWLAGQPGADSGRGVLPAAGLGPDDGQDPQPAAARPRTHGVAGGECHEVLGVSCVASCW